VRVGELSYFQRMEHKFLYLDNAGDCELKARSGPELVSYSNYIYASLCCQTELKGLVSFLEGELKVKKVCKMESHGISN
jgi:hypothetical protein